MRAAFLAGGNQEMGQSHRGAFHRDAKQYDLAFSDFDEALELEPDNHRRRSQLAWNLANEPSAEPRLADKAIQLAEAGLQISATSTSCQRALGVAHYRAGHWKQAIEALEKSVTLRRTMDGKVRDYGVDWFFLAMAHWQLGEQTESRRWYEEAIAWMETNKPDDSKLLRFRAEAAELIAPEQER